MLPINARYWRIEASRKPKINGEYIVNRIDRFLNCTMLTPAIRYEFGLYVI